MTTDRFPLARLLALIVPGALLGGALASQYVGGLYPCELCWFQRYPHIVALVLAVLAFVVPGRGTQRLLVALAAVAVLVSGAIGVFHAGVEYHWWQGITACTMTISGGGRSTDAMLKDLLAAPIVRCDAAQWTLLGVSLAGWNAALSLVGAGVIGWLLRRRV